MSAGIGHHGGGTEMNFPLLAIVSGAVSAVFAVGRQAVRMASEHISLPVSLIDPSYVGGWLQMLISVAVVAYGAYLAMRQKRIAAEREEQALRAAQKVVTPAIVEASKEDREAIMKRIDALEWKIKSLRCQAGGEHNE